MTDILLDTTDYTKTVFIPDPASTDGSGKTGLVAANLTVSYTRVETDNDVVVTDVTGSLSDLAALTTAHTDWGIKEVSNTLAPGLYRIDIADAVFASGAWSVVVYVMITTSAAAASPIEFTLVAVNKLDGVRYGLTALPNAAADAAGGLIISDAGGLDADAQRTDVAAILVDTGTTLDTKINTLQTSVDDLPTNAELATSQASADDATLAAIAALNNLSAAQVNAEVDTALADIRLDELLAADSDIDGAAPPAVGSVFHELMTKTAGSFTYDQTTDSLEAVRDRGDAAWITATGFSTHSAADVWAVGTRILTAIDEDTTTLDLDVTIRAAVGLASANLDTQLSDIQGSADAILIDTTEIGIAGAGLTNITWNAAWDAEVQSEVTDALNAYDPPTRTEATADKDEMLTAVDALPTNAELATALGTADDAVLAQVAFVKTVTDKLDDTLEDFSGLYRFTALALEEAPSGGSAPTAAEIADAVWDEDATAHQTQGTFGQAIGDPGADTDTIWALVNTNLNATVDSRATQASVDDLPTSAELATALGTADDDVLAQVALVKSQTDKLTFDGDNHVVADTRKLSTSATAAGNLEAGALGLVPGTAAAGSTTTSVVTNLTEGTNDHFNGRVIIFTTGALTGQATDITDYNGGTKVLTVTALTEAAADTDAFVIS